MLIKAKKKLWLPDTPFKVATGGGGAAYTFRGVANNNSGTANPSYSVDIGAASADRLIVVGFMCQGSAGASSITVNGVGLTKDVSSAPAAVTEFWSGLVTTGSGVQTIQVNGASNFFERDISVWACTGLSSNLVKHTGAGSGTQNINVTAGDFLFSIAFASAPGTESWSSTSTETAFAEHNMTSARSGDWTVASTNAAFTAAISPATGQASAAASYR